MEINLSITLLHMGMWGWGKVQVAVSCTEGSGFLDCTGGIWSHYEVLHPTSPEALAWSCRDQSCLDQHTQSP